MPKENHVSALLPAFALGSLDRDEEILVSEHLADCSVCRVELLSYEAVTDQLALAAPGAAPPEELKARLLERVQPARPLERSVPQRSWWGNFTHLWQRVAPAWGVVSLVLVVALAISNLTLRQETHESDAIASGMRIVALTGTDAAPGATGTLVLSLDGEHGTLIVDGLPYLDEAQQYQLWLIKDGQRTSGGVFSVSSEGYGGVWVSSTAPLSSYPDFGITIEPAGGSPGPTGDKVLGGSL